MSDGIEGLIMKKCDDVVRNFGMCNIFVQRLHPSYFGHYAPSDRLHPFIKEP